MTRTYPDDDTIRAALRLAVRAPSVHNTQPWQWRIGDDDIRLYADDRRWLRHADPDRRELVLSCGAALHHLRIGMGVSGWESLIHRMPEPANPLHLATLEFRPAAVDAATVRMVRAIARRRSDRRRFTSWQVTDGQVAKIVEAVAAHGIEVRDIADAGARTRLLDAFTQAATAHSSDAVYGAELRRWSGHHAEGAGVAAYDSVVAVDPTVRPFADPELSEAVAHDTDEHSRMLLLSTGSDAPIDWLRVGEATSAVLLTATELGLATCPLTEPLELPEIRERIRTDVLGGFGHPQLIVRMGWAGTSAVPIPASPRLPLFAVVYPLGFMNRVP